MHRNNPNSDISFSSSHQPISASVPVHLLTLSHANTCFTFAVFNTLPLKVMYSLTFFLFLFPSLFPVHPEIVCCTPSLPFTQNKSLLSPQKIDLLPFLVTRFSTLLKLSQPANQEEWSPISLVAFQLFIVHRYIQLHI